MTIAEFSKRISPEREKKIIELYGNYTIRELYNIYLDYVELYYETNYIENPKADYVQNEMIRDFWKGLLNKETIEFSNGPRLIFQRACQKVKTGSVMIKRGNYGNRSSKTS